MMTFREFVAARYGKWPKIGDYPPEPFDDWNAPLFEAVADYLDEIMAEVEKLDAESFLTRVQD